MQIQQRSRFLLDMARQLPTATMAPAAFQRPYAWGKKEVLDLCESIQAGYPLGAFFFWRMNALQARGRIRPYFGPSTIDLEKIPDHAEIDVLLDGQNRLATIAWMMRKPSVESKTEERAFLSGQEKLVWGTDSSLLAYDTQAGSFRFVRDEELDQGLLLPSWLFFDSTERNRFLRGKFNGAWAHLAETEMDKVTQAAEDLFSKFQASTIVSTVLSEASASQAKDAFLKICRVGVPMSEEDFLTASMWEEGNQ